MAIGNLYKDNEMLSLAVKLLLNRNKNKTKIKIWDSGCGFGAEPIAISLILLNEVKQKQFKYKIFASDIDECNLTRKLLQEAVVHFSDIQGFPKHIIKRYFNLSNNSDYYFVSENIIDNICFKKHDLSSFSPISFDFNMIICKNVLKHIDKLYWMDIIKMFHSALVPKGFLIINSEQEMPFEIEFLFKKIFVNNIIILEKIN
jgi:chemotaxis methyl-accepting protein methylase